MFASICRGNRTFGEIMYKVCFVLPGIGRHPVGGYKMTYEYANRLVAEGCDVSILFMNELLYKKYKVPQFIKTNIVNQMTKIEPKWFNLDSRIKKVSTLEHNYEKKLVNLDVCVATAVETVDTVFYDIKARKKVYYIQDYEDWKTDSSYVQKTFALGMENIVISTWLKKIVDQYSKAPSILIQNPIETGKYIAKVPMSNRQKHTIALLYHEGAHKGLNNAFKVLDRVKELYPDLQVKMFGQFPKPKIPDWIEYIRGASQDQTVDIYNWCQVFLCSTIKEGYGLTGIEAMSCGACLVSTGYEGAKEYAINEYNSLLSPIGDIQAQVNNVVRIFEDIDLRNSISSNGIESANKYSWKEAMNKFNKVIGYI